MADTIEFKLADPAFGFLSNFYPAEIETDDGKKWKTSEHLYQALKSNDIKDREYIREANTPGLSRKRGREIALREDWEDVKDEVMLYVLRLKFREGSSLAKKLLLTEDLDLAEWAPWDSYWGLGRDGKGQNKLGQLLMKVREELKS